MMRPRATDAQQSQKPTPRMGLRHLRTSSTDSDPLQRPITEKSPRLAPTDRRSPRGGGGGARSDPIGQRKLGTRITDLETQLVQAQRELKCLKNQLVTTTTESVKGQDDNNSKKNDKRNSHPHPVVQPQQRRQQQQQLLRRKSSGGGGEKKNHCVEEEEEEEVDGKETDVFEVPMEKVTALELPTKAEVIEHPDNNDDGGNATTITTTTDAPLAEPSSQQIPPAVAPFPELEKLVSDESDSKLSNEIVMMQQLKNKLEFTEKERDELSQQNETLKRQLEDAASEINAAKTRELEMSSKLSHTQKELEGCNATNISLKQGMRELEVGKEELEAEMKKLRIQTEQWRKAADAAATVLAGDVEIGGGGRVSGRCGSMEKQSLGGMPELPPIMGVGRYSVGYNMGSPGEEFEDGFGNAKRKGSGGGGGGGGIRMFGDLWKKKAQK